MDQDNDASKLLTELEHEPGIAESVRQHQL